MKIVRYTSQERVDLPDITAMSFLALGEFRRTIRDLLQGPGVAASNNPDARIVRGFAVTAAATPDTTVTVTMDPGGVVPPGVAIGAENLGGVTDHGQLIGGVDSAGELQGNALQVLDFVGQPNGTYTVQVRAVNYDDSTGENDNRAFWNPATNTEFIAAVDTRFLPQWEAQFTLSPVTGDEWISLAVVAWDGVGPIGGAQIIDQRLYSVEGLPNLLSPFGFQADAQDGSGGIVDTFIERSAAREDPTVGANAVFPALRALARQVRDIKGATRPSSGVVADSGLWDWFSRPMAPIDYAGTGLPQGAQHTKSLHSVDTVTYTVGDGSVTFGDFNGAAGLEEALDALDGTTNPTNRPRRAKIVIKSDDRSTVTYAITKDYDFTADGDLTLEIIAETANGASGSGRTGLAEIQCTGGVAGFRLIVQKLVIENLDFDNQTADQGLFDLSEFEARNCELRTTNNDATDLADARFVVRVDRDNDGVLRMEHCDVVGPTQFYDTASAPTLAILKDRGAYFYDVKFAGPVMLNDITDALGTSHLTEGATFDRCQFANTVAYTTGASGIRGLVDGRGCQNVEIRNSKFTLQDREYDALHLGLMSTTIPCYNWTIEGCEFSVTDTARATAVDGAANGADGTGWAIYAHGPTTTTGLDDTSRGLRIVGNYFEGPATSPTTNDSGAIFVERFDQFTIADNTIWRFGCGATSRCEMIRVDNASTLRGSPVIKNNHIAKLSAGSATADVYGVRVYSCDNLLIEGNTINAHDRVGSATTMSSSSAGIEINNTNHARIIGNHVEAWRENQTTGAGIRLEVAALGGCEHNLIANNTIRNNGGWQIECSLNTVSSCVVNSNLIEITVTNGSGINVASTADMVVNDNRIDMSAGGATIGIDWAGTSTTGMCCGNSIHGGTMGASGAGVIYGVQNATRNDLNYVY